MQMGRLLLLSWMLSTMAIEAFAQTQASGGVNWIDPLGYTKPSFISITEPTPGANQYWVNLSGGSGSACTSASPCSWATAQGKPGTHGDGGGAYIYIEGTGSIGSPVLYGTAGNEVVVKPWNDSTLATITGRNNWTSRMQYVIFDGGPNLNIKFVSDNGGQFDPSVYFNDSTAGDEDHITFYRTQWTVPGMGEEISQWGIVTNLYIINSEFHADGSTDTSNQHHIYLSGASNYGPSSNIYLQHNIFRNSPGENLELRLYQNITNLVIDGNAWHDLGQGTCSASWKCRSAITLASSGGNLVSATIMNNLIWNTGEGCIRNWEGAPLIYNNTCYQWGIGTPANGTWGQWGIAGPNGPGGASGTYENNIFYATGTSGGAAKIPYDTSPVTTSNNICPSLPFAGCSQAFQTSGASQTVVTTDPTQPSFMQINSTGSNAYQTGLVITAVTLSYNGLLRAAPLDTGAYAYSSQTIAPPPNIRYVP